MDFLQSILDSTSIPAITAFILGILTAISPCPLATNITAIGFIGKDIENHHRIFINGLLYTLGRIITYTVLGFILIPILREGASMFSLAFCPTSGIFYFGMLMPMSAAETGGYLLPVVYAIATGLPVILVAWVLAYSVAGLGKLYNRIQVFEKWFRKVVAILFIAVGIYYAVMYYL